MQVLDGLILVGMIAAAPSAFALSCKLWFTNKRSLQIPAWRKAIFSVGFLAVAGQLVLFALSWTHTQADYPITWAHMVNRAFILAVPCILAGKGAARLWLLVSSSLLFIMCFFFTLSA